MQNDSEITTPQGNGEGRRPELFSEDELTLSHNQNIVREVFNDVFRILQKSKRLMICKPYLPNQ